MLTSTLLLLLAAQGDASAPSSGLLVAGDTYVAAPHDVGDLGVARLVVNLEGAHCPDARGPSSVGSRGSSNKTRAPKWRLCHTEHTTKSLRALGVVATGAANNHAGDGGEEGRAETRRALASVGIAAIEPGARRCLDGGACVTTWDDRTPLAPVVETLARARERIGVERTREVVLAHRSATDEKAFAAALRELADHGADVVVGTGSHRPGPLEARGESFIFHDVGDLVFDCRCSDSKVGLVVTIPPEGPPFARLVAVAHGADDVIGARPSPQATERVARDLRARSSTLAPGLVIVDDELRFLAASEAPERSPSVQVEAPGYGERRR